MSKTKKPKREAVILQHPTMSTRKDVLSKTLLTTMPDLIRSTDDLQRSAVVGEVVDMLPQSGSSVILSEMDKSLVEIFDKPEDLSAEDRKRLIEHMDDDEVTAQLKALYANEREEMSVNDEIEYWRTRHRSRKPGEDTLFCDSSRYVAWLEFHTPPVVNRGSRDSRKSYWPITVKDKVAKVNGVYHLTHRPYRSEDGPEEFRRSIEQLKQRRGVADDNGQSEKYLIAAVNAGFGPYRGETLSFKGEKRTTSRLRPEATGLIEGYTSQCRYEDVMIEFFLALDLSVLPEYKHCRRTVNSTDQSIKVLSDPLPRKDTPPKAPSVATSYAGITDEEWALATTNQVEKPVEAKADSAEQRTPNPDSTTADSGNAISVLKPSSPKLSKKQRKALKKANKLEQQTSTVHEAPAPLPEPGSLPSKADFHRTGNATHTQRYEQRQPREFDLGMSMWALKEQASYQRLAEVEINDDAYKSLLQNFESFYNYLPDPSSCATAEEYNKVLDHWFSTFDARFKAFKYLYPLELRDTIDQFMVDKMMTSGSCRREARLKSPGTIDPVTVKFLNSINPPTAQRSRLSTGKVEMRSNHPHSEIRQTISLAEKITSKTLESRGLHPYSSLVGELYQEMYRRVDNAEFLHVGPPEPVYAYGDVITTDGLPRAMMRVVGDFKVTETGLWMPTMADKLRLGKEKEEFGLWKWSLSFAQTMANALHKSKGRNLPIQLVNRIEHPDGSVDYVPVTLPPDLIDLIERGKNQQAQGA